MGWLDSVKGALEAPYKAAIEEPYHAFKTKTGQYAANAFLAVATGGQSVPYQVAYYQALAQGASAKQAAKIAKQAAKAQASVGGPPDSSPTPSGPTLILLGVAALVLIVAASGGAREK